MSCGLSAGNLCQEFGLKLPVSISYYPQMLSTSTTDNTLHVVFTGGGTGGHLFPGLAVAEQIVEMVPSARITFAGSGKPFERRRATAAGFEYLTLPCRPLPRRPRDVFSFLKDNAAGYLAARRFLADREVAAVVGLGGYASVPMARCATRRGVPLVLLEQNAVSGKATRWLAPRALLVCAAFEQTRARLRCRCPIRVTGTPIRRGFRRRFPAEGPPCCDREVGVEGSAFRVQGSGLRGDAWNKHCKPRLLVLGGSGGAQSLNENVPKTLNKIRSRLEGWQIMHQSGERDFNKTRKLYRELGLQATVVDFVADMPSVLANTDLAVCRSGGSTLAELAAAGVPGVLLPYPLATDDHQRRNAEVFTQAGGAVLLDERTSSASLADRLAATVDELLGDTVGRARMSAAMHRLARPNATADAAAMIMEVSGVRLEDALRHAAA